MSVGANTYGSVAGVEKLVGDVVASRTFGTGTVPTLAQVEGILDDVASDLNRELEVEGYTVPVASADATARDFLAAANNYGAAATVLGMVPATTYNPDDEETGNERAQMYSRHFAHAIKMIREHRLKAGGTSNLSAIYAGASEDDDGNTKLPLFTRDMGDYPGARSLIEE